MLDLEIRINNFKILRFHGNRHEGDVACYVRNDLSYKILIFFPREIEFISFILYYLTQSH